ncbi:MAG: Hsp20/alpha crystallin family protein [Gammaproteobacteria bacterium]
MRIIGWAPRAATGGDRGLGSSARADAGVQAWRPAVDLIEEADRFVLTADLPGIEPAAIEVTVEDGVLTIRGERRLAQATERGFARHVERRHGAFERRVALPDEADPDSIAARSEHGVLSVEIGKHAHARARRIEIATH